MNKKGFTLIELIIVIAIIAILAAISFVAVNPAKRIGDANNDQRWADITSIAEAWEKYEADTGGSFPAVYTNAIVYAIGTGGFAGGDQCAAVITTANIDLSTLAGASGYLGGVPSDPLGLDSNGNTNYYFKKDGGIITVGACLTYDGTSIVVSR